MDAPKAAGLLLFFLEKRDREVDKKRHLEKQENAKIEDISIEQMIFLKPVGPNGIVITMFS